MLMRGETQKGEEINCYCPVCQPTGNSRDKRLYYRYEKETLLAHCKHGCDFETIAQYFPKRGKPESGWVFLREHIYRKPNGEIFGRKVYSLVNGKKQPTWQRYENGEYINGLNGQKANLYNLPALIENTTDTIWVVEGEKDADTLTGQGLLATSPPNGAGYWATVFNGYFRKRHVIIVPDNDEAGRKHLEKVANNLSKTAKSVRLLDLTHLVPDLKKGGDITDVFAELPNAKDLLLQLASETDSEQTRNTDICYLRNEEGKPLKTYDNFKLMLQHYKIGVKQNSISGIEFSGDLPKMTEENMENVMLGYLYSLSRESGINFQQHEIRSYLLMEADYNQYNPVKCWLQSLPAVKSGYIRKYFDCLILDEPEKANKERYLTFFGKWLIQCVAMQFNELKKPAGADGTFGLQCQHEGIGKTSYFRNLCFEPRYFKDSVSLDPASTDSVRRATSFWISELGEIESTLAKDLARLKAFITEDYDTYRIPFAVGMSSRPRRTSFCFTCNSDRFLKDGDNRRFWTVPIMGVDLKALKSIDIRHVWSEAHQRYIKDPQSYRLTPDEIAWLRDNNREKFGFRVNEEEVLRDKLDFEAEASQWFYWTATDISNELFNDRNHARIIGKILTDRLGYSKDSRSFKHFRIQRGIKQYFVPLKKYPKNLRPSV